MRTARRRSNSQARTTVVQHRLPSAPAGDTLDLDSARLLHKDGHPAGVQGGYTKEGIKPCRHPLLAVLAEVRLVAPRQYQLRPQRHRLHAGSVGQPAAAYSPARRARGCRLLPAGTAGVMGSAHLPYVVVAQLNQPLQKLIKGDLLWTPTEVPETEVAEWEYQALSWPHPRRLVELRHRVSDAEFRGGKCLQDVPGPSLPRPGDESVQGHPPAPERVALLPRLADCENVIKELQAGFALPTLCLEQFWATEAALSLACLTYNLVVRFERHLGWQEKVTLRNLLFWLFVTAGVVSHPVGQTTIKLAVPERARDWWRRLWEKLLSPFPNCHAVENQPPFTSRAT